MDIPNVLFIIIILHLMASLGAHKFRGINVCFQRPQFSLAY